MDRLRIGVIGLGWFGEIHCDAIIGTPSLELAALCTRTEDRLNELGKKYGVKKLYKDYKDMLADPDIDAVSITTMWDQHTDITIDALKAGKHVFLEKPMASTVADCEKIIAVEASPITFKKLVQNITDSNIICINFVACNNGGKDITFYQGDADTLSTVNEEWFLNPESRFHNHPHFPIICNTITLDGLISEFGVPDLIKIDVEGGEYECITSLTQKVKLLCFEWASETNTITYNCIDYLHNLGYTQYYIQNEDNYVFRPNDNDFYDINTTKRYLSMTVPKHDWGMIWCK